jgi:ATP-dependent Clp protease ATP-binding subunit ClpC
MNGFNFTGRTRKVLALARTETSRLRHEYTGTEHILLGLIREGNGVGITVIRNLGIDPDQLRATVEQQLPKSKAETETGPEHPFTSRAKKVLELAMAAAYNLDHAYVGTEHILLGLLAEAKGIPAQVLRAHGITLETARAETIRLLGETPRMNMARNSSGMESISARKPLSYTIEIEIDASTTHLRRFGGGS